MQIIFSEPASIEELVGFFSSVDLVETGDTMRAAGLEVVADILETEVQFYFFNLKLCNKCKEISSSEHGCYMPRLVPYKMFPFSAMYNFNPLTSLKISMSGSLFLICPVFS